jgi:hypothetical protein
MDDHHYFYNDSQFGSQKQILTKTPVWNEWEWPEWCKRLLC